MGFFSETARAAARGASVRSTLLVHFDFKTTPLRVHPGFGPLLAGGQQWDGLGGLASISGLESAIGATAPQTTFALSGVDPANIARALANSSEVKDRDVTVFIQFYDDDLALLDAPYAIALLTMDVMKVKATGAAQRTVELTAETVWIKRSAAPWGYLSDRSQQALFPGDNGLDQLPTMQNKTVDWPVYS